MQLCVLHLYHKVKVLEYAFPTFRKQLNYLIVIVVPIGTMASLQHPSAVHKVPWQTIIFIIYIINNKKFHKLKGNILICTINSEIMVILTRYIESTMTFKPILNY